MGRTEPLARPLDALLGGGIQPSAQSAPRCSIVVAQQRDRAARDMVDQRIEHPLRVGAIADEIAKEHELIDPMLGGMRQAGLERLPIGVDIGHQRGRHVRWFRRVLKRILPWGGEGDCPPWIDRQDPTAGDYNSGPGKWRKCISAGEGAQGAARSGVPPRQPIIPERLAGGCQRGFVARVGALTFSI